VLLQILLYVALDWFTNFSTTQRVKLRCSEPIRFV